MSRDTRGGEDVIPLCAEKRARRGVVNDRAAMQQPFLKALGTLAHIVGQTRKLTVRSRVERLRESTAQRRRSVQMLRDRLVDRFARIALANMRKI